MEAFSGWRASAHGQGEGYIGLFKGFPAYAVALVAYYKNGFFGAGKPEKMVLRLMRPRDSISAAF